MNQAIVIQREEKGGILYHILRHYGISIIK